MLTSLLCLNNCDKILAAAKEAKYSLCQLTGLLDHHIQRHFSKLFAFCVLLACLLACSPSEMCFFLLLFVGGLVKTRTLLVHVIVVLGRLVDHLNKGAEGERKDVEQGYICMCLYEVKDLFKRILPDHPWSQWS